VVKIGVPAPRKIESSSGRRPAGLLRRLPGELLVCAPPLSCRHAIGSSPKPDLPANCFTFPFVHLRELGYPPNLAVSYFGGSTSHGCGGQPKSTPTERVVQEKGHPDTAMFSGSVSHHFFYCPSSWTMLPQSLFSLYICGAARRRSHAFGILTLAALRPCRPRCRRHRAANRRH
jgi:hypothetical protein